MRGKFNRKMDSTISIFLGPPEHGWLPVDFYYQDFHLEFDASGVLNDPIEELYHVITKLENNEYRQVIWWLEPGAYLFDFKKSGQHTTLTITETKYLHNQDAEKKTLIEINVGLSLVILNTIKFTGCYRKKTT
jgi:hypothetical protein